MPNKKKQIPTNTKADSKAEVQLSAVTFAELWGVYPEGTPYVDPKTGDVPKGFENQCAIRMSVTLHRVGIEMQSFRGKGQIRLDGKRTAVLAAEMAEWLKLKPMAGMGGRPKTSPASIGRRRSRAVPALLPSRTTGNVTESPEEAVATSTSGTDRA